MRREQACRFAATPAGARRVVSRGLGLASLAALAGWMLLAPPSLAGEPVAATATTPPSGPAFYTVAISRLKIVEPDTFEITRGNLKPITVRLAGASCEGLDKTQREQALALVTQILEPEPFWVFPCGLAKEGADAWRALIWTKKGWLSEVLIKALLATRRPDPFDGAALPADKLHYDQPPPGPCEPAFQGVLRQMVDGNTLEVLRDGKTLKVRLFDVGCEGGSGEDAKALATKLMGTDPVWIFPSSQRRLAAGEAMPVRVWTKEGWLSQAMVKGGFAKVFPDPDKTDATAVAAKPDPAAAKDPKTKDPAPVKEPKHTPSSSNFVWREVPVSQRTSKDTLLECMSDVFKVTSPEWRIQWDMVPARNGAQIILGIYRVDEKWQTQISATQIIGFTGNSGAQVIHSLPGDYWIKVTQGTKLKVKVEVKEPAEKGK
jgi:endonuclease YncB( thermonuclease family)